jgi:poly(hydroxyalkanoate) depolymerase family esterase
MMAFGWSSANRPETPEPTADRVTEVAVFGSNPGALRMLVYEPPTPTRAGMPLIVVLHGCRQRGAAFAAQTGWLEAARGLGIPLVLPEQVAANNRHLCFNWFKPGDVARSRGEAMSIRQMVRTAILRFGSDRRRVFVVGLSAGGAMTAAMLAAYPAVFAGGAVVAGMPVGAADTSAMALLRIHRADPLGTRAALVAAVHARASSSARRRWPRLSIWQGALDRTVDPANAELLAEQWTSLHGVDGDAATDALDEFGSRRRTWGRADKPAVEFWTIPGLAHGFPVDAAASGVGSAAPWVIDAGIAAVRHILAFWGVAPAPGRGG